MASAVRGKGLAELHGAGFPGSLFLCGGIGAVWGYLPALEDAA